MKQQRPIQCRYEQNQKGKIPLFTITPSITKVLSWVTTAGHTKFLLSVSGIIRPIKERMKGMIALLTFVLGMVNLLDGLWKLKRLSAIPQAKKERLQKQQYLQKRLELLTNSASLQSRSSISLMKQKAGTLARMKRIENALGVVFANVYFITAIFSFIISDTCFAGYFQVLKQRFN